MNYAEFLHAKSQGGADSGFAPVWMPSFLFDFQSAMVDWAVRKGRAAIFADCGLGKTPIPSYYRQAVKNVQMAASGRKDIETSEAFDFGDADES